MNILLQRGNFNGNRSVPSNFMLDIEYSDITGDVIKSFDCININNYTCIIFAYRGILNNSQTQIEKAIIC